jgi:hypothetical protein
VRVTVGPPDSEDIRAAYAAYDLEAIGELLGPAISEQTEWAGEADRRYETR